MHRRRFLTTTTATGAIAALPDIAAARDDIPADFPFVKKRHDLLGSHIAYIDEGTGRPIVFLHGNPTSSYLWRNIIPHMPDGTRSIAPDLIGMGDSGKPDISYRYLDHANYLFDFLDQQKLENAVFVVHDWGSALGMHYMRERPGTVTALAFMEAILPCGFPVESYEAMGPLGDLFRNLRAPGIGEKMVLDENYFIETILPELGVVRDLSDAEMTAYRAPFLTRADRLPTLQWPREVPIANEPPEVAEIIRQNGAWLMQTDIPKLLFHAEPGAIMPPEAVAWLKSNLTNLETRFLGAGTHFLQEDHPHRIGKGIADWLHTLT